MFKQMAGIKAFERSKWFSPGNYIVEINATKFVQNKRKTSVIIETIVLGTDADDENAPQPDEIAAQVIVCSGEWGELGLANWKQFLTIVLQVEDPETVSDEQWEKWTDEAFEEQGLKGVRLHLQCWHKAKKSNPAEVFTVHQWSYPTEAQLKKFGIQ